MEIEVIEVIEVKVIAVVLIFGAILGSMATRLSEAEGAPIPLEVVEKVVEKVVEPNIGGVEVEIEPVPEMTFSMPIVAEDWYVSSDSGLRISPRYKILAKHQAVDISVKNPRNGMPQIAAIADGFILHHWFDHETRGKYIVIQHDNGMKSGYSHLSESFIHERRPDGSRWRVKAGEPIGRMGDTGIAYGAHLDFQLWVHDKLENPMLYINEVLPEWEAEA